MWLTLGVSVAALQRNTVVLSMVLTTVSGKPALQKHASTSEFSPHQCDLGKSFCRCYHREIILDDTGVSNSRRDQCFYNEMSLGSEENAIEDRGRDCHDVATDEGIQKLPGAIRNLQWFCSRQNPPKDWSQDCGILGSRTKEITL